MVKKKTKKKTAKSQTRKTAKKTAKKKPAKRGTAHSTQKRVKKPASKSPRPAVKKTPRRPAAPPVAPTPSAPVVPPPAIPTPVTPPEEKIGVVTHFYSHLGVAVVKLERGHLRVGETIHVKGHTSDFRQRVESLELEHQKIPMATAGQECGLSVIQHAREGDEVYKVAG